MSKILASVIVPIFNVEKFLHQCLNSIYELSMNIEVILVNDGSTDSSLTIINQFKMLYPKNTIVISQSHSSVSAARNVGLANASGEWIIFIDSDDFIDSAKMKRILEYISTSKSDVVAFDGYRYVEETGNVLSLNSRQNPFSNAGIVTGRQYLTTLIEKSMINVVTVWDKTYRKSMLDRIGLKFIEGVVHEDVAYIFTLFINDVSVEYRSEKVIYYRQRAGSIMHTPSPHRITSKIKVIEYLLNLYAEKNLNNTVLNDYLVFSVKNLIMDGHKVPVALLTKLRDKTLSFKKRIFLFVLRVINFKNRAVT